VSVLTTGFDAPHVDVIALLRPTESASLYQQIIGRGLRLSPGKADCLVLDYTGQGHDLYSPEINEAKPATGAVMVEVPCPACGTTNHFWGVRDEEGEVEEHFGRRCQGTFEDPVTGEMQDCGFRFRFKLCPDCGTENDIAARACLSCRGVLVDPDKRLKDVMALKDAHVMRVESMDFAKSRDKRGSERLEVLYRDADANLLKEFFYLDSSEARRAFYFNFTRFHSRIPELPLEIRGVDEALSLRKRFRPPLFVVARKDKRWWAVREKIF
jgi:DNA repair protein RadD